MKTVNSHLILPASLSVGSFLSLIGIVVLTNPVSDVSYAVIFFLVTLIFLLSFGHLWLRLRGRSATATSRNRLFILSTLLVIALMLNSVGSLSWLDLLIVAILATGLLFYAGRRSL